MMQVQLRINDSVRNSPLVTCLMCMSDRMIVYMSGLEPWKELRQPSATQVQEETGHTEVFVHLIPQAEATLVKKAWPELVGLMVVCTLCCSHCTANYF